MEEKLKNLVEDLSYLEAIKVGDYVLDLMYDNKDEPLGLSLKDTQGSKTTEVVWVDVTDEDEFELSVSPQVEDDKDPGFWAILYCIANRVLPEDESLRDEDAVEYAERIFKERNESLEAGLTKDLERSMQEINLENIQGELHQVVGDDEEFKLNVDVEVFKDLIQIYEEDELDLIFEFINSLLALHGYDIELDAMYEGEDGEIIENDKKEKVGGVMDPTYVYHNLATLMNRELTREGEIDREAMVFLNQILYERTYINKRLGL